MTHLCKFAAVSLPLVLLLGCASNRVDIPAGADLVAQGNEKLTYQVPADGTVYIYDDSANRLIYSGDVKRGETVAVDARGDSLMIDSRRAGEWDLDPDHRYQIYFDEPRTQRRVIIEERREERR